MSFSIHSPTFALVFHKSAHPFAPLSVLVYRCFLVIIAVVPLLDHEPLTMMATAMRMVEAILTLFLQQQKHLHSDDIVVADPPISHPVPFSTMVEDKCSLMMMAVAVVAKEKYCC